MTGLVTSATPAVSVLTTCFNRAETVGETIESVLASSFEDFEYIIVDDCSTDSSFDLISRYAGRDRRLRVYRNSKNLGDYANRNRAAAYAEGELLKFVDSDDIAYPHMLSVMVRCMQSFPEAGLGLSAAASVECPYPVCLTPAEAYAFHFEQTDLFGRSPGSAIIRRRSFEQAGGFSGRPQIGDFEMWLKLSCLNSVVVMPAALYWCRIHPAQEQQYDNPAMKHAMKLQVLRELQESGTCPLPAEQLAGHIRRFDGRYRRDQLRSLLGRAAFSPWSTFIGHRNRKLTDLPRQ